MIHRKIAILLIFVICFSSFHLVKDIEKCNASSEPKFYVDDDYDNRTSEWQRYKFDRIQDAINSDLCSSGDRIIVLNGTYFENIIVNKSVDIFGEDRENTIIDGGSNGNVITVNSTNVDISSFKIQKSGSEVNDAGIMVNADNCRIVDNIIMNCKNGIFINSSNTVTLSYNKITENTNAIFLESSCNTNTISYNTIESNLGEGIFLNSTCDSNIMSDNNIYSNNYNGIYLHDHCNQNVISGNNIYSNSETGIRIENSSNNEITDNNTIKNNGYYGIFILGSNNKIKGCIIKSNSKHGIFLLADDNTTVSNNNIKSNTLDGVRMQNSTDNIVKTNRIVTNSRYGTYINYYAVGNLVYNNLFEENTYNSKDISSGENSWSTSKTYGSNIINGPYIGGNYWDDYNGSDTNDDGIGEESYLIGEGESKDNLPLMYRLPTADTGGPYSASTGEEIIFDATSSTSPDGTITSYVWNFGDGDTSTGSKPSHTYTEAGTYTVTLTIHNDLDGSDSDTTTATITDDNTAPTITVNQRGDTDESSNLFTFSAYITDNVELDKVWIEYWYAGSNGTMTASMENTIGDLYKKIITAKETIDRIYCVMYANDTSGNTADTKAPHADITGTYSGYQVLQEITFNATDSFDLDGNITSYTWDFGDGTAGTGVKTKHTYFADDEYTIELTVTDDDEKTDSDRLTIRISALDSINASTSTIDTLETWSNTTLNESFFAYDTDGDGIMDAFSDENDMLSAVQSNSFNVNGKTSFLISVNNDLNKLYIWNVEDDEIINVTYQTSIITEDTINEENTQRIVKIQANKADWTYIETTDNYPEDEIIKIVRSSDDSQISDDMIWRKNNKIYILDDPSTVYRIYYEYSPPPLEDAVFIPERGSTIGEQNTTITITYNVPVQIIDADFYNFITGTHIYMKDEIEVIDDNKTFQYTPPHDLEEGQYQLLLDVKSIEGGQTSEDIAVFIFVPYTPLEEKIPMINIFIILGILGGTALVLYIITKKTDINLESFIYFKNKKIIPFFKPLVFGPLRINVKEDNIKKAEFYLNGELKKTLTEPPYIWDFDESGISKSKIETKIYDEQGNTDSTGEMTFYVVNGPKIFK